MVKILTIYGSPRRKGNTSLLLKKSVQGAIEAGAEVGMGYKIVAHSGILIWLETKLKIHAAESKMVLRYQVPMIAGIKKPPLF